MSSAVTRSTTTTLVVLFGAIWLACSAPESSTTPGADGGLDGGQETDGGPTDSVEAVWARATSAWCNVLVRCEPFFADRGQDGCEQVVEKVFQSNTAEVPGAVEAEKEGRIRVDTAAVEACSQAVSEMECGPYEGIDVLYSVPACRRMIVGLVSEGEPCHDIAFFATGLLFSECQDGYCATDQSCPGTCTGFLARGDKCTNGGGCDPRPDWCDAQGTGTCQPRKAEGQGCYYDQECQAGLVCTSSGCVAPKAAGEPCAEYRECLSGLCVAGHCTDHAGMGEMCLSQAQCPDGAVCSSYSCQEAGSAGDGAACTTTKDCAPPLSCVSDSGTTTCRALSAPGEACGYGCMHLTQCGSDGQCESALPAVYCKLP